MPIHHEWDGLSTRTCVSETTAEKCVENSGRPKTRCNITDACNQLSMSCSPSDAKVTLNAPMTYFDEGRTEQGEPGTEVAYA